MALQSIQLTNPLDLSQYRYRKQCVRDEEGKLLGLNLAGMGLTDEELKAYLEEDLSELKVLNLSENKLKQPVFPKMAALQKLDLSENPDLEVLDYQDISGKLTHIDLSECSIREFVLHKGLADLLEIDLRNNQLQHFYLKGLFPKLQSLDLSQNKLEHFALEEDFDALRYLYLNDNQLVTLALEVSLGSLKVFHLRNNRVESLPERLGEWDALETLYVYGNPLSSIPKQFIHEDQRGNSINEIRGYLRSLQVDKKVLNDEVKLVFLGNSTAGKTSLMQYLTTRKFSEKTSSTHGIFGKLWKPKGKDFTVNIWDFGGQEFYHATHRLFLTDNAVSLVLFEQDSNYQHEQNTSIWLEEAGKLIQKEILLEHFPYQYWLESLLYFCSGEESPTICLIQNKTDKSPYIPIPDTDKVDYHIPEEQIFRLSVKSAFEREKTFIRKFEDFEEKLFDLMETKKGGQRYFNNKWLEIKQELRKKAKDKVLMTTDEYKAFCEAIRPNISQVEKQGEKSMLDLLSQYLHDTGVILKYDNIPELSDRIFIHPQWVTDIIYKVLNYGVMKNGGKFDRHHVNQVIRQHVANEVERFDANQLISLMKNFELIFEIKLNNRMFFIAPQYLPDQRPSELSHTLSFVQTQTAFYLYYPDFLPKSVMLRFIAHFGPETHNNLVWKNGIAFGNNGKLAIVICDYQNRLIEVAVQDDEMPLKQKIYKHFQKINKRYGRVQISCDGREYVSIEKLKLHPQANPVILSESGVQLEYAPFTEIIAEEIGQGGDYSRAKNLKDATIKTEVEKAAKRIFFMYASEDLPYVEEFRQHFATLERSRNVKTFYDRMIEPGVEWDAEIKEQLQQTDIYLLMLSPAFMGVEYIWNTELKIAESRIENARIVPIFLRAVHTEGLWFMKYQGASKGKTWIASQRERPKRDELWLELIEKLKKVIRPEGP